MSGLAGQLAPYLRADVLTWSIAGLATLGVIIRPFRWPEAIWAASGATLLVLLGLVAPIAAWTGILRGLDVYLFLIGMMMLAEIARHAGLFDWLAAKATRAARGSAARLFLLVYLIGTLVTVFLSNDATAVVLTPAVYAATRAAKVRDPLPYLYVCAFIANAASFVLPISNPANLVVFGAGHMPPLGEWLHLFLLPSIASIVATYVALRLLLRRDISGETIAATVEAPRLSTAGRIAALGLGATAIGLVAVSFAGLELGLPTLLAAVVTTVLILAATGQSPTPVLRGISWSVLPLVAGLFVFVEALDDTGVIRLLASALRSAIQAAGTSEAAALAGGVVALASNLANNLPVGLVAGSAMQQGDLPSPVAAAILIGVDLGPNLSVTGSLATILWLTALRREGIHVGPWRFLKLGILVMPPALVLALTALLV